LPLRRLRSVRLDAAKSCAVFLALRSWAFGSFVPTSHYSFFVSSLVQFSLVRAYSSPSFSFFYSKRALFPLCECHRQIKALPSSPPLFKNPPPPRTAFVKCPAQSQRLLSPTVTRALFRLRPFQTSSLLAFFSSTVPFN